MRRITWEREVNLPIFPLNNCLFPDGILSLNIFEIRYLKMIKRLVMREDVSGLTC